MLDQISLSIDLSETQLFKTTKSNYPQNIHHADRQNSIQNTIQNQKFHDQKDQSLNFKLVPSLFSQNFNCLFYDKYFQGSSLNIYNSNHKNTNLTQQFGGSSKNIFKNKAKIFYSTIQSLSNKYSSQLPFNVICQTFRLNDIQNLVSVKLSQNQQTSLLIYNEEGIELQKVESWKFKHQTNYIPFLGRQKLFINLLLVVEFINRIYKEKLFQSCQKLSMRDFILTKNSKHPQSQGQFQIKIKLSWLYNLLNGTSNNQQNREYQILQCIRKAIKLLIGIGEQKSKLNQIQTLHNQRIQNLITFDDLIKLNYTDFHFNPQKAASNLPKPLEDVEQVIKMKKQQAHKMKQIIMKLQQEYKKQLNSNKNKLNQSNLPKIVQMTKTSNKKFWFQLQQFMIQNLTQSQRANLILKERNKKNQNKGSQSDQKNEKIINKVSGKTNQISSTGKKLTQKQTKSQKQQKNRNQKQIKEQANEFSEKIQQQKKQSQKQNQINIEFDYIASGSDIKLRPQKLYSLIQQKQGLFYIMKVRNQNQKIPVYIAFCSNSVIPKNWTPFFGQYITDASKKSFIYSSKTQKIYNLLDKNYAVGYGPEIFMTIGKIDIVIPCLSSEVIEGKQIVKCASYFPVSYSDKGRSVNELQKQQEADRNQNIIGTKQVKQINQLGLQKQFYLQEVDIYQVKYNVRNAK